MKAHIEHGRVIVNATPAELVELEGKIRQLVEAQAAHDEKLAAEHPGHKYAPGAATIALCFEYVEPEAG